MIPYSTYSYWEKDQMTGPWDFVIVGAGVTGLNAAIELKRQKPTLRVLVLEPRNPARWPAPGQRVFCVWAALPSRC